MAKIGLHHLVHRVPVETSQDTDLSQPVHENHIGHQIRESRPRSAPSAWWPAGDGKGTRRQMKASLGSCRSLAR